MADFHFLRPWWLLALPLGVLLILIAARAKASAGGWRGVVDAALQPFVLSGADVLRERRWPLAAALAAWVLATVALAGPAWERQPVPAFRTNEALVVALDLSRSMDAADLQPSLLTRARLKLLSLLERRAGGQTGLVVFSANAFTVTPLTTDTRTISSLVGALSTDIMPSQGSYIEAGLDKAASLLRQADASEGEILVISDADVSAQALEKARELRGEGIRTSVLAVGTEAGAPIPERNGGFLTDRSGHVVLPRLDAAALGKLAEAGGGRFARLTADDRDLDAIEPVQQAGAVQASADADGDPANGGGADDDQHEADVWLDGGRWLALLLLPLVAAGFRRGWLCVWLLCGLLPLSAVHAQSASTRAGGASAQSGQNAPDRQNGQNGQNAQNGQDAQTAPNAQTSRPDAVGAKASQAQREPGFSFTNAWRSLWRRPDQRGAAALEAHEPVQAARLFRDREWRAAAQYRAGDYRGSAASLGTVDNAQADYNRGNALARAGQLQGAISAYDRALELNPGDEDARYNRDVVQRLLDQQKDQPPPQQQAGEDQQQKGEEQSAGGQSKENPQQSAQGSESGEQQQAQNSSGQSQQSGGDSSEGDPGADDQRAADAESGKNQSESKPGEDDSGTDKAEKQAGQAPEAPGPQDVEQWASEQAADQWLRRVPQDPGGLLRRKFLYQYQRLGVDQDGHYVWPGDQKEPW
jgi:Ca-activated chloride channel family protein